MIKRNTKQFSNRTLAHKAALLLICAVLAACANQTIAPLPTDPEPAPEIPTPPAIDPVLLHQWLDAADAAIAAGQLTYPASGSAFEFYTKILARQPDQDDAGRGMERIVELFIERAERAVERRRYASARSNLSRARLILPEHPSIEPTATLIRLMSAADRKKLSLSQTELRSQDMNTKQKLASLARPAAPDQCRYIISAKNDAQGRWIYQQLAAGANTARIRAQIQIRLPASVERLCFVS